MIRFMIKKLKYQKRKQDKIYMKVDSVNMKFKEWDRKGIHSYNIVVNIINTNRKCEKSK